MQKVTSMLPSWDKTKSGSKKGFDTAWKALDKLGKPINRFSNKIGSEAFWPTTLDKESNKAARILKSFCKDGFYAEEDRPTDQDGAKGKQRVLKKIPQRVIQNAVGLAIFTTMRSGLWISGAGGSGVLVARQEDGTWSPPSGILLHTAGLGFLVGVDIYDCVVVINNRKALESFTKIRATLGGEISAVAGPAGVGGILENDGKWKQANRPVFTYLKSRGFYAGVQVDGTVIIERTDENERFYGQKIGVADILAGKARHPPYEIKMLMETLKAAEGSNNVDDEAMRELDAEPAPADYEISSPTGDAPSFGIPEPDDPDPFGVLALEKEGFEIREAGTRQRPTSEQFEFNPSPTSPVYNKFHRQSVDNFGGAYSNRASYMSAKSFRTTRTSTSEAGTQTEDDITAITTPTSSGEHKRIVEEDEGQADAQHEDVDYTKIDLGPYVKADHGNDLDGTTVAESPREQDAAAQHKGDSSYGTDDEDYLEDGEEPVVLEVAAPAKATVLKPHAVKARGGLINIPKRPPPPPLPPRNTARSSKVLMVDEGTCQTPMKDGFEEVPLHAVPTPGEEQIKTLVMQDLADSNASRQSLETVVAEALEDQHLEKIDTKESEKLANGKLTVPATPASDMKSMLWTASHEASEQSDATSPATPATPAVNGAAAAAAPTSAPAPTSAQAEEKETATT